METFHSSVQSLGNSSAQLQAWPKNKGDAHLLSPLAQPESSPAWAAAGASGDVLLETLCMALGLEPGGTVTLQTDRHSWGAQGDNPLALLGHQGGWEGRCPWDCMREMLPLHQHAGERYQRGDPSSTGQKHRGTNGGGGETCTYHCPPPAPPHWGAQHRRAGGTCPSCPTAQRAGAATATPSTGCAGGQHPQTALSTSECGGGEAHRNRLSSPCTGHENRVY